MIISDTIPLGGPGVNRAAHLRDAASRATLWAAPSARVWVFWDDTLVWRGDTPVSVTPTDALVRDHGQDALVRDHGQDALFLGLADDGPVFAVSLPGDAPPPGTEPRDLRQWIGALDVEAGSMVSAAQGLLAWHKTHGFCAFCGGKSHMADGGWRRDCPDCGRPHFPRTDPVVIMLVTSGDDVLLGRSPGWPEGMYSLLAGFMEPGETIEAAVRREVYEETGVHCGDVRYLASQPWPFPSSLMIGCAAQATTRDITVDPVEIETALWVPRAQVLEAFAGTHPTIRQPRPTAIAAVLLRNWLADCLP